MACLLSLSLLPPAYPTCYMLLHLLLRGRVAFQRCFFPLCVVYVRSFLFNVRFIVLWPRTCCVQALLWARSAGTSKASPTASKDLSKLCGNNIKQNATRSFLNVCSATSIQWNGWQLAYFNVSDRDPILPAELQQLFEFLLFSVPSKITEMFQHCLQLPVRIAAAGRLCTGWNLLARL
jgi:hypothetical protein